MKPERKHRRPVVAILVVAPARLVRFSRGLGEAPVRAPTLDLHQHQALEEQGTCRLALGGYMVGPALSNVDVRQSWRRRAAKRPRSLPAPAARPRESSPKSSQSRPSGG